MHNSKKLYIANIDEVSLKVENSFIMCGSKNWDFYFTQKDDNTYYEELENVKLIEFNTKYEFEKFILKNDCIDYSLEHRNPMVLCHG